jgi:hypothetical protein
MFIFNVVTDAGLAGVRNMIKIEKKMKETMESERKKTSGLTCCVR